MAQKAKVYIETSVISYLTANPSRDLIVAAHQQVTKEWWERSRDKFDPYASVLILREAGAGDRKGAQKRLQVLKDMPLLEIRQEAVNLAQFFIKKGPIPEKAGVDALHIATAVIHGMDYLLTWNCRHIANAEIRQKIIQISEQQGYNCPVICTPEELMGV